MSKVLFIGDIFGRGGRDFVISAIPTLRKQYNPDFIISNGENVSHGRGLSMDSADELLSAGIDLFTMGNHVWGNADIFNYIDSYNIVRPYNLAKGLPGNGYMVIEKNGKRLGVANLMGRVYMDATNNPFDAVDEVIDSLSSVTPCILIDFHAEATAEKIAMGYYVDGRVSALVGTHTHVQTADEKILEGGTAYITDVGMSGPTGGVIGMDRKNVIKKFKDSLPYKFTPSDGPCSISAVLIEIDDESGKALNIQRIQMNGAK